MSNIPQYVDRDIKSGLNCAYWGGSWEKKTYTRLVQYGLIDLRGKLTEKGTQLRNRIIETTDQMWSRREFMKKHPAYKPSKIRSL